jgi:lysophospholipase L1-like esterase
MNPAFLYFASGESLYPGATLLVATVAIGHLNDRWMSLLRNIAAWIGLALIIMASPPFRWLTEIAFLATFAIWYFASNSVLFARSFRIATAATLTLFLVSGIVFEFSHRQLPEILFGPVSDHLVVIGDSISAGLDRRNAPWPTLFQQMTGVQVRNLAQAGATSTDAIKMASQVTPEDGVVLIEIGGNDLLGGVSSEQFGVSLDTILRKVAAPRRVVVMFELPLIPTRIAFGRIQRRAAAKYGVRLIPKRYFAQVVSGADATSDGIHLTQTGMQRMSNLVVQLLLPVLKPTRSS